MTTKSLHLSVLATFASRGFIEQADHDDHPSVPLSKAVGAALELTDILALAAVNHQSTDATEHRGHAALQYAVGRVHQEVPVVVVRRLADHASNLKRELKGIEEGDASLDEERFQDLAEAFARFAIVLRDFDL